MSVFFCDSNCELWYDKADKLGLNIISMPYTIDGQEYFYDMGRATDFKDFFGRVRAGSVPITSMLSPQNYTDYFEPVFARGEDIFYLSFSHELSGTFNSMNTAVAELKEKYPDRNFTCYDSKSISMGAGLIVYEAAKKHATGVSDAELVAYLDDLKKHVSAYFTVDDLFHLKRGGRISGTAALLGSVLGLKPLLMLTADGKITSYAKAKGRKKSIERLLDKAAELELDTAYPVSVLDADAVDGDYFEKAVKDRFKGAEIWHQSVGPVIGTHCGPGTLGLCFVHKKEKTK